MADFFIRRPIVAIPTTSGTGAEVTRTCIVSDRSGRKLWTWGDEMLPDLVVLDPTAAATMPMAVTVGTGLDAFVHAIEACSGRRRSSIATAAAQRAIALVSRYLPLAAADGTDLRARQGMQEAAFLAGKRPTVVYFGKLLHNKGVHVLLEALRDLDARAVLVGFGDYRAELEAMADPDRTLFTGPLEHRHLVHLLALADACVVPSIFPEAFGMVAAEAAAAGCPPLVARHSGLAEIAEGLEAEYPPHLRDLASFASGDAADLHAKLVRLLSLEGEDRREIREAARRAAVERWSWAGVAERLLDLGR